MTIWVDIVQNTQHNTIRYNIFGLGELFMCVCVCARIRSSRICEGLLPHWSNNSRVRETRWNRTNTHKTEIWLCMVMEGGDKAKTNHLICDDAKYYTKRKTNKTYFSRYRSFDNLAMIICCWCCQPITKTRWNQTFIVCIEISGRCYWHCLVFGVFVRHKWIFTIHSFLCDL